MADLALPSQTRVINGTSYRVDLLLMDQWEELLVLVIHGAGKPLAGLFASLQDPAALAGVVGALQGTGGNLGAMLAPMGQALAELSRTLDVPTLRRLRELLAGCCYADGDVLHMDRQSRYWPRHMRDYGPWLSFALEVQLGDFFGGLLPESLPDLERGNGPDGSPIT